MPKSKPIEPVISLHKAARKYGIPKQTLSRWVQQGRIKVVKRPEKRGQSLLVDEESVVLAKHTYRPWLRGFREKCPLCGQKIFPPDTQIPLSKK